MSLTYVNRVCPKCNNPNYMRSLDGLCNMFQYKCINCNSYFTYDDLAEKTDTIETDGTVIPWEHLWDAPDSTFKGRCKKCGFVHYFIEGHVTQYRFCPQCGEQKEI